MNHKVLSPLAGPPHTTESTDVDGARVIKAHLSSVAPFATNWSARLGFISGAGSVLAAAAIVLGSSSFGAEQFVVIAGAGPAGWASSRYFLRQVLRSRASVVFTPDEITVRRLLRRTKVFNRNVSYSFTRIQHDKKESEARRIRWLETTFGKKWFNLPYKPYCGRSEHVALIYLNQRHDIITICHDRQPERIHARLLAASDIMDGYANRGGGQAMRPSDDWTTPSHNVIETF